MALSSLASRPPSGRSQGAWAPVCNTNRFVVSSKVKPSGTSLAKKLGEKRRRNGGWASVFGEPSGCFKRLPSRPMGGPTRLLERALFCPTPPWSKAPQKEHMPSKIGRLPTFVPRKNQRASS